MQKLGEWEQRLEIAHDRRAALVDIIVEQVGGMKGHSISAEGRDMKISGPLRYRNPLLLAKLQLLCYREGCDDRFNTLLT